MRSAIVSSAEWFRDTFSRAAWFRPLEDHGFSQYDPALRFRLMFPLIFTGPHTIRNSGIAANLTVAVSAILLIAGCGTDGSAEHVPDSDSVYRNWAQDAQYVGRETCQTCHPVRYKSFVQSQMGRSWKKASLSLSVADFDDPEPIYSESEDLYYLPFHKGEDLFVREYRLAGADTVHNRVEQIDYIVGSGQHTNSHIFESNGYLYQIPLTWYAQDGKWGMPPGFSRGNSRFSRPITQQCMTCHNGYSEFDTGSENRFISVPSGIGCEKCHGPGSIHVEEKRAGIVVDVSREIDYSIVNPRKLSPQRQLDVCKRCHMQAAEVFVEGRAVDSFRPGQVLSETVNVFFPRQADSVEVFMMASHPDRLAMSECFQASWAQDSNFEPMTCSTCHDPHLSIELAREKTNSETCQSCHLTDSTPSCSEPSVAAGINNASCSSCHMPLSETLDIPNVRITDHFIRVVRSPGELSEDEVESRRKFIRLASLIDKRPTDSNIAEGFLSYYELITDRPGMLDSAEVYLRRARTTEPEADLSESFIRLWYLRLEYQKIRSFVRSSNRDVFSSAWSFFRIGEAYAASNDFGIAIDYLETAVDMSPGHLRFKERLASTYTESGRPARALELYEEIDAVNPNLEDAVTNRGYAHMVAGDFDRAELDFLHAISLYPDAEVALANLASVYANTGREGQAKTLIERLISLDPGNRRYIQMFRAVSQ